jgi:hypothetical protein
MYIVRVAFALAISTQPIVKYLNKRFEFNYFEFS